MNPFDNLRPMPPSPCGCAPRPWPRPVVPVPVTPQMQPHWAEELKRVIDGKQDAISDLDDIREGAQAGATAYQKPEDGVPKTDLSEGVQASLDKADSAYQKPEDGIPKSDLEEEVQASLDNADTAVQPDDILSGGKVKSDLLPSYVDDVIEVANYAALPETGESGKIYVTLDTNKTYRWGGSEYVEISNPDLTNYIQKKSGATAGNFAKFTATGDIEDSGKKPTDFANATHSHAQSDVTGLNAALAAKADKTYVDAKSSIKSPDGDTAVSADDSGTAKVTKTTHTLGNPAVTFPALYNISYYDTSWTSEYGITMEFVGPVPSSVPYAPNDEFYYYSALGTLDSYDPSEYDAWCIWVSGGRKHLMYKTGPFYDIDDFDSASPSLTLNQGESTSEPPVMTRTDSTSSTTKTVATTDQIPAVPAPYTSNPNMDGSASAGLSDKFSRGDHVHPTDTTRAADNAVVKLTGDQTISGDKTFQGKVNIDTAAGGELSIDNSIDNASAKLEVVYVDTQTGDILRAVIKDGLGNTHTVAFPNSSGTLALTADLLAKLNSTAAAPDFSATATYDVGNRVTYKGVLYECVVAKTTASATTPDNDIYDSTHTTNHWKVTDMTTPDATVDITADNKLRIVGADGTLLWQQGYDLKGASSNTPSDGAETPYEFAANASDAVTLTLPSVASGKVGDFLIDVTNPALDSTAATYPSAFDSAATYAVGDKVVYDGKIWRCTTAVSTAGAWTGSTNWEEAWPYFTIAGLDSTLSVAVPKGENLTDILSFAPGTMCELLFTLSAFKINSRPTWVVARKDVENGGASA